MTKKMTNEQYLTKNVICIDYLKTACPACGISLAELESGERIFSGHELWAYYTCLECGSKWKEIYSFSRYTKRLMIWPIWLKTTNYRLKND